MSWINYYSVNEGYENNLERWLYEVIDESHICFRYFMISKRIENGKPIKDFILVRDDGSMYYWRDASPYGHFDIKKFTDGSIEIRRIESVVSFLRLRELRRKKEEKKSAGKEGN